MTLGARSRGCCSRSRSSRCSWGAATGRARRRQPRRGAARARGRGRRTGPRRGDDLLRRLDQRPRRAAAGRGQPGDVRLRRAGRRGVPALRRGQPGRFVVPRRSRAASTGRTTAPRPAPAAGPTPAAGASTTTVTDGSVEGWRYGTGGAPGFVSFCAVVGCGPPPTEPPPATQAPPPVTAAPPGGGAGDRRAGPAPRRPRRHARPTPAKADTQGLGRRPTGGRTSDAATATTRPTAGGHVDDRARTAAPRRPTTTARTRPAPSEVAAGGTGGGGDGGSPDRRDRGARGRRAAGVGGGLCCGAGARGPAPG